MGLFDDFSQFLETRLEEFLRNNPHLELQALLEQIEEQQRDALNLIAELQQQQTRLQAEILAVAREIQTWHGRIEKAKDAGRLDLAQAAQQREAALLRHGNQLWGQMEGVKKRLVSAQELLRQIQQRRAEVKAKSAQVQAAQAASQTASSWDTVGWNQGASYSSYSSAVDPLEAEFERWEMDEELEQMKRNLGR